MQLDELQKHWNAFAKRDPFWAILTAPEKENGRWRPEEFFTTGKSEIDGLMQSIAAFHWTGRRQRALDFGCGVGRLTQALCDYFAECFGVDIAEEMLRLADEFNRRGSRCSYRLNTTDDLSLFSENYFDFIYSNIVLQHMKPEYAKNYIREFLRVLAPGGLIVFQLPCEIMTSSSAAKTSMPLPAEAFRAAIRPIAVPRRMLSSSATQVVVVVKNMSNCTWPRSSVRLGNHWLTENGNAVAFDDGRAELPRDLPPGSEEQLTLRITAPRDAGAYLLELDMVQEWVAWFKQHGSETVGIPVEAQAAQEKSLEPPAETSKARMEMYGTPLEAVVSVVIDSGGRFIEIREDSCAGSDWRSYRYCITKDERMDGESRDRYYFSEYDIPLS